MAGEAGDKNVEISDSERKLDALVDMIKDACMKMDEGGKRLDARMDAMEENFKRADARMDAMSKKDEEEETEKEKELRLAEEKKEKHEEEEKREERGDSKRKDAEAEKKEKEEREEGEPKEMAADKRKDSSKKDEDEMADRKDAKKDSEKEDKEGEVKDSQYITKAEAAALQAQIASLTARVPAILTTADRERFARIQEQADPVFQAFNDRAPAPLDGETPAQYKRRLGSKLQAHSPKWKDARLSAVSDEAMLDTILSDVYADSMVAARKGVEVPRGQLRMRTRQSGGHTINEFDGDADSWMNSLAGHSQRATGNWLRPH